MRQLSFCRHGVLLCDTFCTTTQQKEEASSRGGALAAGILPRIAHTCLVGSFLHFLRHSTPLISPSAWVEGLPFYKSLSSRIFYASPFFALPGCGTLLHHKIRTKKRLQVLALACL
jgi:hypothetical protein